MDNNNIARIFEEMGDILDIQGADFFRVNAYKKAAITVLNLPFDLRDAVEKAPEKLKHLPGIGEGMRQKIVELVTTGMCQEYEQLKKSTPEGLLEMLNLRGIGAKKVKLFYGELGITNLKQLKKAAEQHKIAALEKMGEKSEQNILSAINEYDSFSPERSLISKALREAVHLIDYLKKFSEIKDIEYAGSLRRWEETIGDIDILVTVHDFKKGTEKVMEYFGKYKEVLNVLSVGDTKSSVVLESGIQVDLRVVDDDSFGAALHYFTGSKNHNIKIRDLAKKKGLKVNEYGIFKGEKKLAGKKEKDVFDLVGLPYIIPEIRKDEGEIEYGLKHKKFPKFIESEDIKADLHVHSKYSDGNNTIAEMAKAFMSKGYEYFAMTDHSSVMGVTGGMGSREIKEQWKEIDELNKKLKGKIFILKGSEVDILKDGSLDFKEEILKQLDIVIASAHMYQRLTQEEQTKRLINAIENPYTKILGHPSGRLINRRQAMEFNMEKIIDACIANKVILEINANPSRLDLADKYIRIAKDKGAKFVISTDSHSIDNTDLMEFGLHLARRGWLTKEDVVNTRTLKDFLKYAREQKLTSAV